MPGGISSRRILTPYLRTSVVPILLDMRRNVSIFTSPQSDYIQEIMKVLSHLLICLLFLVLPFAAKAQITDRVPKNVIQTGELAQDPSAIVFVVDGYVWMSPDFTYEELGTRDDEEILDRFVKAVPFISKDDIDSYALIKSEEWAKHRIYAQVPKDTILITTKKESRIKTFTLNGKPTKRLRGIVLGALLDEVLLKQQIQKRWRIKSNTIIGLIIDGKAISITTK